MFLRAEHTALEKELQMKESNWARDRVGLDQQLLTQMKRGDDYKYQADCLCTERDEAPKERNALQVELEALPSSNNQLVAEAQAVHNELAAALEEARTMAAKLASLKVTASYAILHGSLRVSHTPSKAELQWLSEGELACAGGATTDFRATDWRALQELMNTQWDEIANARDMLTAHKKAIPEFTCSLLSTPVYDSWLLGSRITCGDIWPLICPALHRQRCLWPKSSEQHPSAPLPASWSTSSTRVQAETLNFDRSWRLHSKRPSSTKSSRNNGQPTWIACIGKARRMRTTFVRCHQPFRS